MQERLGIAGSGDDRVRAGGRGRPARRGRPVGALRGLGRAGARAAARCAADRRHGRRDVRVTDHLDALARRHLRGRGGRRGPRGQGRPATRSCTTDWPTTPCSPRRRPRCRSATWPQASGRPERFVGLHVFNPVDEDGAGRARPHEQAGDDARARARALCEALGKTPVEVPDVPGFVVNRLLFPYLFSAVRLLEDTGLEPDAVDDVHEAGRRPSDGPARRCSTSSASTWRSRSARQIGVDVPARCARWSPRARSGARPGAGFHAYE